LVAELFALARDAREAARARIRFAAEEIAGARIERADAVLVVLFERAPRHAGRVRGVHRRARGGGFAEAEHVSDFVRRDASKVDRAGPSVARENVRRAVDVHVCVVDVTLPVDVHDRSRDRPRVEHRRPGRVLEVDAADSIVARTGARRARDVRAKRGARDAPPRARGDLDLGVLEVAQIAALRKADLERHGQGRHRPRSLRKPGRPIRGSTASVRGEFPKGSAVGETRDGHLFVRERGPFGVNFNYHRVHDRNLHHA